MTTDCTVLLAPAPMLPHAFPNKEYHILAPNR